MKDLIDERNKMEKMQRSILKWWNVHYMTPEELEEEQEKEDEASGSGTKHRSGSEEPPGHEEEHDAQGIMEHIERTAKEQEAKKQREIEAAVSEAEGNYNPRTGAYSGSYGVGGADSEYKDQIAAILMEKEDALRDLIEQVEEGE